MALGTRAEAMTEALCFDVYGSTHNQHSTPVRRLMDVVGIPERVARDVSERWAQVQLRYSLEVTMMDSYEMWWTLADRALQFALDYHGLEVSGAEHEEILDAYRHLEPYEDWAPFERLAAEYDLYILSDGNPQMLETLARNTGFNDYLSGIVSVHQTRAYKPRPEVYELMEQHVAGGLADCIMVATHQFDIVGAMQAGMAGAFVNRFGEPANRLGFYPDWTVDSYAELADTLC